jgi:uncharacterized phage-associated protein
MYDARGVANFFIERAQQAKRPITVMTLQKVLYFAHAWHLAKYDLALVAQPFEAWRYGPVNRVVYEQMKELGSRPIESKLVSLNPDACQFQETTYCFDAETTKFLENIFDYYSQFHPFKLSDLTHEEGSPWDVVWTDAEKRAVPGMIIPDALIKRWFREGGGFHLRPVRRDEAI